MKKIYELEGIRGFWKGNNSNVVRCIPNRAILFTSNDFYKKIFFEHFASAPMPLVSGVTGAVAGATAVLSTYPLDLVRGRMGGLYGETKYNTMWNTLKVTAQEEGYRGLYKGVGPTFIGSLPYEGLKFAIYDTLMVLVPVC